MNARRGSLGLLLLLTASCGGVVEMGVDGSSGADGGSADAASEVPDGGPPDLPDTGPPSCPDPERWYRDLDGDRHGDAAASVESCEPVEGFVESADDCDDTCAACHPGAPEACDGRDNDCDGSVDQTFACVAGATVGCTTECGTAGMGACTAACAIPSGAACTAPAELCNGADDDCDGAIDDGFTCAVGSASVCTTTCGSIGTGACTGACEPAPASACAPPAESCNGMDDDCDGAPDQSFACVLGARVPCTSACGTTGSGTCTSACAIPTGAACAPPAETCNGMDDDCDGTVDDGFTCAAGRSASCTTSCGSTGTGTCTSACMPASASACMPPTETCTYADDDCDGLIDEGVVRVGPRELLPDYYSFVRPKVARGAGGLYSVWRMNSWTYLWILDEEGRYAGTPRVQLQTGDHFDLESNGSSAVYAYVDRTSGDVYVHRIATSPTSTAPYVWTRIIDTDAEEVELAVGSVYVWVYTRNASGRVEYHTLSLSSGALDSGSPRYVAITPRPIAVTSNGYVEHLVAYYVASGRILWNIRRDTTLSALGSFAVDGARLRDLAIAGDYTTSGVVTRRGLVVAYALSAGSGLPNELRYYSWATGGATADAQLATLTVPLRPTSQLDLEMADGIALLGAVTTSSTAATSGVPRVYQLARNATSAGYDTTLVSTGLPSAAHEALSVVRFPDSRGPIPDRLFYDPTEDGTSSVPIGCF